MKSTKPENTYFDYIDIETIDNHKHIITTPKRVLTKNSPSRASRALETGSVLFSLVRPYLENIAFVPPDFSHCIASTGFYICNSNGSLFTEYLYYLMLSKYVVEGLNRYMKGDNSPSISKDDIENWLYPIPPLKEQIRLCTEIRKLNSTIASIEMGIS